MEAVFSVISARASFTVGKVVRSTRTQVARRSWKASAQEHVSSRRCSAPGRWPRDPPPPCHRTRQSAAQGRFEGPGTTQWRHVTAADQEKRLLRFPSRHECERSSGDVVLLERGGWRNVGVTTPRQQTSGRESWRPNGMLREEGGVTCGGSIVQSFPSAPLTCLPRDPPST